MRAVDASASPPGQARSSDLVKMGLGGPPGMLLNSRRCTLNSQSAYERICERGLACFQVSGEAVFGIKSFHSFSSGPIFMVHDPASVDLTVPEGLLAAQTGKIPNGLVFELFFPAGDGSSPSFGVSCHQRLACGGHPDAHRHQIRLTGA